MPFTIDTASINDLKPNCYWYFCAKFDIRNLNKAGMNALKFGKGTVNVSLSNTRPIYWIQTW
jgi:hypothetical protein